MKSLNRYGPWCLITGASSGIGRAYAIELAKQGFNVFMVARRQDKLQEVQSQIRALGQKAEFERIDLSQPQDLIAGFQRIEDRGLDIGLVVNNAGLGHFGRLNELGSDKISEMIDVNCRAVSLVAAALSNALIERAKTRKKTAMIIVSSVVARIPSPFFSVYSASKAFDFIFAESLASEWKALGIDVQNVIPGLTESGFHKVAGVDPKAIPAPTRSSEQVVSSSLKFLGKRRSVVDGIWNDLLLRALHFLPISWVSQIAYTQSRKRLDSSK